MEILEVALRAVLAVGAVMALTRMNGLRSFSKISGYDFAITVAMGSLLASTIVSTDTDIRIGLMALASTFAIQFVISILRRRMSTVQHLIDNEPLLLAENGEMLVENMRAARVTEDDLYGKLREANVQSMDQMRAAILETTGNISILHGPAGGQALQERMLTGVRRTLPGKSA